MNLLGAAGAERRHLGRQVRRGLAHDLVLLSGGLSVGLHDLVTEVLADLGCRVLIRHVAMRPGKLVLFARGPSGQLVFGLPGNAVGVLVTCRLFVRSVVRKLMGRKRDVVRHRARLQAECRKEAGRTRFLPACTVRRRDGLAAEPVPWHGSSDLIAASRANSLIVLPKSVTRRQVGETVTVYLPEPGDA